MTAGPGPSSGRPDRTSHRQRRSRDGEQLTVPPADFASYYGRPVLKPPVWKHDIAGYLFTGGLAAGSALIGAGAQLTGRPGLRKVGRGRPSAASPPARTCWSTTSAGRPGSITCSGSPR